tara:strand:+ start:105 stop:335 length:231 start_codon:yes stop_codon:yes gene_type:complete
MPVMTSAVNVVRPKPSVGELLFDEELVLLSTEHELFITFLDYLERGLLQKKIRQLYKPYRIQVIEEDLLKPSKTSW